MAILRVRGEDGVVREVLALRGEQGDQGLPGADGHTPERGVDYWTEADKGEIKRYVDEAILGGAW